MSEQPPILVVEDNEDDVFLLQRAGKKINLENLVFVSDGQQAIDYLHGDGRYGNRDEFPMPNLVLLDLKLPFKSGFEVLEWIRNQPELSSLVVIMLTSSREERDICQAAQLGANSYLTKPPTLQELSDLLASVHNYWLHHHQFPSKVCLNQTRKTDFERGHGFLA